MTAGMTVLLWRLDSVPTMMLTASWILLWSDWS
jgi:hypothetical protein